MIRAVALLSLAFVILVSGCLFSPKTEDPIDDTKKYPEDLSHPDSLMNQLTTAYVRRDTDKYAELLSKEFVFKFAPGSPEAIEEPDGLTFTSDSTRTDNMFRASEVIDIRLTMTWKTPVSTIWLNEFETQRVDLDQLRLEVETNLNDTTYLVEGDLNSFYFRVGEPDQGEDPERFYLLGWEDFGGIGEGAPKFGPLSKRLDDPQTDQAGNRIVRVTMSELRGIMSTF